MLPPATPKPDLTATVKHMAGMLWYDMLDAMNANGLGSGALGTGGDNFQSMFLWNLAQNDFGKYDTGLISAAVRQVSGISNQPPVAEAPEISTPLAHLLPVPVSDAVKIAAALPEVAASSGGLLAQAKSFAKSIWPQITQAAQALGVPPVAVLAQTALETGWGASAAGNNLFGIKAADGQAGTIRATHEMVDGVLVPQTASFRDYGDTGDAINDYVGLIQSGYQNATGQNTVAGFAQALQDGGYATDQNYAAKIIHIAQSPLMAQVLKSVGSPAPQSDYSNNSTGGI